MEKYVLKISIQTTQNTVRMHTDKWEVLKEGPKTVTIQFVDKDGYNEGKKKQKKRTQFMQPNSGIMRSDSLRFTYSCIWCFPEDELEARNMLVEKVRDSIQNKYDHVNNQLKAFNKWRPGIEKQLESL